MAGKLVASIFFAAALSACGDDDSPRPNMPNKSVKSVQLGDAVVLRSRTGQALRADVTGVFDPIRDHPSEDARVDGRFVGIELRLTNYGEIPYRGSPWSGSWLSTTRGAERPTKILKQGTCLGTVRRVIPAGGRERLCLPFRVKRGAELLKFRYSPEGGFAPSAAVWDLPR